MQACLVKRLLAYLLKLIANQKTWMPSWLHMSIQTISTEWVFWLASMVWICMPMKRPGRLWKIASILARWMPRKSIFLKWAKPKPLEILILRVLVLVMMRSHRSSIALWRMIRVLSCWLIQVMLVIVWQELSRMQMAILSSPTMM